MNVQVCARFVIICLTNGNHFECDTGDFHFAWECLRVTFHAPWGSERDKGSLANLKDVASRKHADRGVKVFSIGDELLQHAFEAHLLAAITTTLSMSSPEVSLPEQSEKSLSWLQTTATSIALKTVVAKDPPVDSRKADHLYLMHRRLLHFGFLYTQLREAIRNENGPKIINSWKYWLIFFLGAGRRNYSTEAANLLANLKADWSKSMAYIATHNRTVNRTGKPGRGKPIDQQIEHYNL